MHNYFFPTVFSFLFSMSLFNTLNILQLHDYKDYYSWKHFNVLPCKLCNVYFNCVFTNWFFPHYGYFLASLNIGNFFLFKFMYLSYCYCYCQVTSVVSDSVWPHIWQPTRLLRPWDSPGENTGVGCHFLLQCMKVKSESKVAQSCLTLSNPMDCSLPGSSIHGIFEARVLEYLS